ncbi:PEGA domain protein [Botrimarina colliarenosi]|uniref:PEGA domain protein n=1 Tax=Botrimarina colliarenosi TaxID=2528001 RepID=A0A5C6AHW5_9BACT|nr:PEGA domain-containing protein [Botrimarina colliarenosi]TWT99584.1 PEGA domain protein [Botrimarina colliarenosi]
MPQPPDRRRRYQAALVVLLTVLTASGCVRRRLTVRSNPPGAVVHVDNQRIGSTPCSVDYVYYGTREIRLSMPGFETLTVNQPLPPPWYELPGIDFVSENLVPARLEDARTVSFNLQRARLEPAEQIIARGEDLRRQVTPVGAAPVVPASAVDPFGGFTPPTGPIDPPPVIRSPPAPLSPQPGSTPAPNGFRY